MNQIARWHSAVFTLIVLAAGCGAGPATDPLQLPDGSTVHIEAQGPLFFTSGERALQLKYRTEVSIEAKVQLRTQAEAVWNLFRPVVESNGFDCAVLLAANQPVEYGVSTRTVRGFVIKKNEDGRWEWESDKRETEPNAQIDSTGPAEKQGA